MEKIKKFTIVMLIIVALIVGFTLPTSAGEKEDLALKIYVDTAVLQTMLKEFQQLKKQIEVNQRKLNALIRPDEKPKLKEEEKEEGK